MSLTTGLLFTLLAVAANQATAHNFCFYTINTIVTGSVSQESTTFHLVEDSECSHSISEVEKAMQFKPAEWGPDPAPQPTLNKPIMSATKYGEGILSTNPDVTKNVFCTGGLCSGCEVSWYEQRDTWEGSSYQVAVLMRGFLNCNDNMGLWWWNGKKVV